MKAIPLAGFRGPGVAIPGALPPVGTLAAGSRPRPQRPTPVAPGHRLSLPRMA
jgi:hypothetical protein